jgi:AraC-like DNA-binding protein
MADERASAFTDRAVAIDDVFGHAWRIVVERLEAQGPEAALEESFGLLRVRARGRKVDRLLGAVTQASSVGEAAAALGMPARTFHERTQDVVGLPPKRLLRILRLYRALSAFGAPLGWAGAAAQAGFADQPHLARELHALLGDTPGRWVARGASPGLVLPIRSRRARPRVDTAPA